MFTGGGFIIVIIVINNRISILALLKQTHELSFRGSGTFYVLKLFSNIKQERDLTP